jgi:hypothetical protein
VLLVLIELDPHLSAQSPADRIFTSCKFSSTVPIKNLDIQTQKIVMGKGGKDGVHLDLFLDGICQIQLLVIIQMSSHAHAFFPQN